MAFFLPHVEGTFQNGPTVLATTSKEGVILHGAEEQGPATRSRAFISGEDFSAGKVKQLQSHRSSAETADKKQMTN